MIGDCEIRESLNFENSDQFLSISFLLKFYVIHQFELILQAIETVNSFEFSSEIEEKTLRVLKINIQNKLEQFVSPLKKIFTQKLAFDWNPRQKFHSSIFKNHSS